jgi:uncharacterized protein YebE (UPF0316 family)
MSETDWYTWVFLPLLIFVARVIDVGLGTLRIIFTARGKRQLAPLLGFVEVFIWVAVISQMVRGVNHVVAYLAYAAGFAAGNYVGMWIENRLALGTLVMRIILAQSGDFLADSLHEAGYGVTRVDGMGANGPVKLIYTIVRRKDLPGVLEIIHQTTPKAFIAIEEVRSTEQGIFPYGGKFMRSNRKGK